MPERKSRTRSYRMGSIYSTVFSLHRWLLSFPFIGLFQLSGKQRPRRGSGDSPEVQWLGLQCVGVGRGWLGNGGPYRATPWERRVQKRLQNVSLWTTLPDQHFHIQHQQLHIPYHLHLPTSGPTPIAFRFKW